MSSDTKVLYDTNYEDETSSDLVSADESKSTAEEAEEKSVIAQAARLINYNASCGQRSALWQHPMPDYLKDKLEGDGYTLDQLDDAADPDSLTWIKW